MLLGVLKQSSAARIKMITEGNIIKNLMFLSIPGTLMILIQALMPIIDSIFVYNFDNALSGAAISYITSVQNIFVNGAQGFSAASGAVIGQMNGSGNSRAEGECPGS
jgi:Na+-driven multidrug efflux pump